MTEIEQLYEQRIAQLEAQLRQATSPWTAEDVAGRDASYLEELAKFDAEPAICALRRQYAIARAGGYEEGAAIRVALKILRDILDSVDRPKLSIVKGDDDANA